LDWICGIAGLERQLRCPVLTIGNFDGLHLGHRAIMQTVVERARSLNGEAVVYTFDPHPRKVVRSDRVPRLLTTLAQKRELLEEMGVDVVIVEPFDRDFARLSPEVFIREFIDESIRPKELYVGYDFHFGRDREGSMRLLATLGPRLGFSVTIVPEVTIGKRDVNSTRIRELLSQGDVSEAAILLGRSFRVRGRIVRGAMRGHQIGFPTANLELENEILPAAGVYAGQLHFLDQGEPERGALLPVVTNVGLRPTFEDGRGLVAESHILDFDGEVYERRVELAFEYRLRPERKFSGIDELREQITRDVRGARDRLGLP